MVNFSLLPYTFHLKARERASERMEMEMEMDLEMETNAQHLIGSVSSSPLPSPHYTLYLSAEV